MEIRRFKRGEKCAIWSVYFAATHESNARDYHPDLIERWAPHDQDMGRWAERLAQKNPFIATVGDEIVGMAEIESDDRLFVEMLGLDRKEPVCLVEYQIGRGNRFRGIGCLRGCSDCEQRNRQEELVWFCFHKIIRS